LKTQELAPIMAQTQAVVILIGQTVDNGIYILVPNQTRTFRLVTFVPAGTVRSFAFVLDPTLTDSSEQVIWQNQQNTYC